MRGFRRLAIAVLTLTVTVGAMLSGCTSKPETQTNPSTGTSTNTAPAPREITILMEAVPDTDYVIQLADQFTQKTNIKVNFEVVNYSVMHEKLIPQLTAAKGSYDVIVVDNYWVGEFTSAGWLEDLAPYLAKSPEVKTDVYLPSMFNMVGQVKGTTYMLPFYNYAMAMIYRTDVMENPDLKAKYKAKFGKDLAMPTNMDEYLQLTTFISKESGLGIHGAVMQGLRPDPISMEWLNYLYALGGDFYGSDGKPIINNEIGVKALELYVRNMKEAAPEGAAAFGFDEAFTVLAQGKAATYVTYNWMLPKLSDPKESQVVGLVDIAPMPGGSSLNGGWGWAIPKSSPDKEAAWEFLKWVESFEVAKQRALAGGSPTRSDVFDDKDVLAKYPHYTKVKDILAKAKMIPIIEQAPTLIEVLGRELSESVIGAKSPKEALDQVAKEIATLK